MDFPRQPGTHSSSNNHTAFQLQLFATATITMLSKSSFVVMMALSAVNIASAAPSTLDSTAHMLDKRTDFHFRFCEEYLLGPFSSKDSRPSYYNILVYLVDQGRTCDHNASPITTEPYLNFSP